MISVLTYGRNDGHGYNLAKRAALSFNCIAELLDDPDDEIIFVDCNSEDDYATLPESIADTLTPKAQSLLRTFRVRRSLYRERSRGSHLPLLESFSRNVGLRRANPRNRWVLSTNPDMIFVTPDGCSLNGILGDLPAGYYAAPRYELPESMWESFDRSNPQAVLEELRAQSTDVRLHLAVRGDPWNGYDAPGDFQLAPLAAAIEIGGFHEGMVRGWHVDSNFAKRFSLLYQKPAASLHDQIRTYHMMHLRMLTSGHTGKAIRGANSLKTFVNKVVTPVPADQPADWGAPQRDIEQVFLVEKRRPFWLLGQGESKAEFLRNGQEIEFTDYSSQTGINLNWFASLDRIQYYLANAFDYLPAGLRVCLWSGNPGMQEFMRRMAYDKNWELSIVAYSAQGKTSVNPEIQEIVPDIAIFDFTVHFLPRVGNEAEFSKRRVHFQVSLVAELSTLGYRVIGGKYQVNPTLYCLGVTHTEIEGFISSTTPNWDQTPQPLGFKRGRFSASDRNNAVARFVKWQSARVKMAAEVRGEKTVGDRIALECLRFVGRFTAPS
jgi:hypothetical protein